MKKTRILSTIIFVLFVLGPFLIYLGVAHSKEHMRNASMIDTSADTSTYKGITHWNTYGVFRDEETGKLFSSSIGDKLYRQFADGGNKPIATRWPYSDDNINQTSIGVFYFIFGVIAILVGLGLVCELGAGWRENKTE